MVFKFRAQYFSFLRSSVLSGLILFSFFFFQLNQTQAMEWRPPQGSLLQKSIGYLEPLDEYVNYESRTQAEIELGLQNDFLGMRLLPSAQMRAPFQQGGTTRTTRTDFDFKEAWIETIHDSWEIRVGNQFIVWGGSDWANPTDVWAATDFVDPFDPQKYSQLAAKLVIHPPSADQFLLEMIYAPGFRANRLPIRIPKVGEDPHSFSLQDSRWLIGLPSQVALSAGFDMPLEYEVMAPLVPAQWQAGLRLRFLRLMGWDLSIAAAQFVEKTPDFVVEARGSITSPNLAVITRLKPVYSRMNMLGGDIVGSIGELGLRIEFASIFPAETKDNQIQRKTFFLASGLDRTWSSFLGSELYINVSSIFKQKTQEKTDAIATLLPDFDPWNRNLAILIESRWDQKYFFGTRVINSFVNEDRWIHPFVKMIFFESFTAELSADLFFGNNTGTFGQYGENDRAGLSLVWEF